MVYLNIIDPSPISDIFANILLMIPVGNEKFDNSEYQSYEVKNITFRELSTTRITEIKVLITDPAGYPVAFDNDNVNIHLIFTNEPEVYKIKKLKICIFIKKYKSKCPTIIG